MIQPVAFFGFAFNCSTRRNRTKVFGNIRSPGYHSHLAGERSNVSPGADSNGFTANGAAGAPGASEDLAASAATAAGVTAADKATRPEDFKNSRRGMPVE